MEDLGKPRPGVLGAGRPGLSCALAPTAAATIARPAGSRHWAAVADPSAHERADAKDRNAVQAQRGVSKWLALDRGSLTWAVSPARGRAPASSGRRPSVAPNRAHLTTAAFAGAPRSRARAAIARGSRRRRADRASWADRPPWSGWRGRYPR